MPPHYVSSRGRGETYIGGPSFQIVHAPSKTATIPQTRGAGANRITTVGDVPAMQPRTTRSLFDLLEEAA